MEIAYVDALKHLSGNVCPRRSVTAPNRLETSNWDLLAAIAHCQDLGAFEVLREQFRKMSGRAHIFFAPSARSAIAQVLSMLPQEEVVVPAFTCAVVRDAAEVAGKRIIYVDVSRDSLNATSEYYERAAKPGRILIPTHLFGIPTDIAQICNLARDRGCVTIEDAAAAFPAWLGGRMLGTFGDVGIVSFERSKRVPAFRGAAIIVNNEKLFDLTRLARHRMVPATTAMPVRELLFCLWYNLATTPFIYGRFALPRRLQYYMDRSSVERATTASDSSSSSAKSSTPAAAAATNEFYSREFHPYQAALVAGMLKRMDKIRDHLRRLSTIYQDAFRDTPIQTFVPAGCDTAGLHRFPIVFSGRERGEILRAALRHGLFLETNYERLLPDEPNQASFPNSLWASQNAVLLPLYSALPAETARELASEVIKVEQETFHRQSASVGAYDCGR